MVISSPCLTDIKNWLVQKQTTFGKDFLNPFTVDSLLKTIWFSTHHALHAPCYSNEALAILEQTATGKEISNPFMAGEDCWVLEDFTTYCCWFNIGAASEDLVLLRKIEENSLIIRVKQQQLNLGVGTERMIFNIDSAMKYSYSNNDTCFSIDVIDEILEEDFDALLDEGRKILHSIKGTLLEEEIFSEFDEFMAMTADENSESESDTEEPPFKKITINTNYKIKTSLEEPSMDLELKPLPDNLEYVFLEEPSFLPVIISFKLSTQNKNKLVSILKKHKEAFAWKTTDIPGICPSFCKYKIQLLDDKKSVVQKQRRLNPNMQEVVKKEIIKLLDKGIIYPIANSPWVSPIHCVPKKGGSIVVTNKNDELIPTRTVTGW
ncbi:hypothetical protein Tco_1388665 [Tanacetum coccineum]